MKVILFGATGMVGQGVLRECLLDPGVDRVLVVGRSSTGQSDPKLEEIVHKDGFDYEPIADRMAGSDACFFCLGVSSAGMNEAEYRKITFDMTLAAAKTLARVSPKLTFVYVSGAGTDSTGAGRSMWARVKGQTENALLELPFHAAFMFRPGFIQPMHGIKSKTTLYRAAYAIGAPLYPLFKAMVPKLVTTSENVGRAMLEVAKHGYAEKRLENADINALATNSAA